MIGVSYGGLPAMPSWIAGIGAHAAHLARQHASRDGREVLLANSVHDPRIDDIARRADSIFVISETLTYADAVSVIGRLAMADRSSSASELDVGCPVGFLHARTREATDEFSARLLSGPSLAGSSLTDVIVDSTLASLPREAAPGLVLLPYQGMKASDIRDAGSMRVFAITAHGMPDHVYLDSDYLCGKRRAPARVPGGLHFLPSCAKEPYICLFRPTGSPLPAYEIAAQHLFVNSCGSSQFEQGEFGPDFSLWYSALEGHTRSYVGTLRWKDGHGLEALLYRHLLNAGFPLGLAVAILNRVLSGHRLESGQVHCLLGDPLERVATRVTPDLTQEMKSPECGMDMSGGFARCVIKDPGLVSAWREGKLLMHAAGPPTVYFSGVPSLREPAVHVFAASYANRNGKTTVRVDDYRPLERRIIEIRKAFTTMPAADFGTAGMYPNAIRQGGAENARNRILNISRIFRQSSTKPQSIPNLFRSYKRLEQDIAGMDKATAADILGRIRKSVFSISDYYRETFEMVGSDSSRSCPRCQMKATQRVLRSLIDSSVERRELICPLCGIIEDIPDERLSAVLSSASPMIPGQEFGVTLTIENHDGATAHGYCAAGITKSDEYCAQAPDSPSWIEIPPGRTRAVNFSFTFKEGTRPHLYTVKSALVVTGRIYMCRRPVGIAAADTAASSS
jgi:hypothetical protein